MIESVIMNPDFNDLEVSAWKIAHQGCLNHRKLEQSSLTTLR